MSKIIDVSRKGKDILLVTFCDLYSVEVLGIWIDALGLETFADNVRIIAEIEYDRESSGKLVESAMDKIQEKEMLNEKYIYGNEVLMKKIRERVSRDGVDSLIKDIENRSIFEVIEEFLDEESSKQIFDQYMLESYHQEAEEE